MKKQDVARIAQLVDLDTPEAAAELGQLSAKLAETARSRRALHRQAAKRQGVRPSREEVSDDWAHAHLERYQSERGKDRVLDARRALELAHADVDLAGQPAIEIAKEFRSDLLHARCAAEAERVRAEMQAEIDEKTARITQLEHELAVARRTRSEPPATSDDFTFIPLG